MYRYFFKRIIDLFISIVALTLLLPLLVLLYLLLSIYYKGDPFFYQERAGYKTKAFSIMKFKSMVDAFDRDGKPLPDVARITNVGAFLRKTSIDELPQLINVIKGDMSFIGPRPLYPRYLPHYSTREQLRHEVKPGITGLAQVSGRNNLTWNDRLELDAQYVESLSASLDLRIFGQTVKNVLLRRDIAVIPGEVYQPLDIERKL